MRLAVENDELAFGYLSWASKIVVSNLNPGVMMKW
jgi:hypothetical protein